MPIAQFRQECREFAAHWIELQKAEFQRLGVDRRLGQPVHDDGLFGRGADRPRDRQVPGQWRALPGLEAGAVVGGRDRPRWPRPRSNITTTARPRSGCAFRSCAAGRPALAGAAARDLDDDALDLARATARSPSARSSNTSLIRVDAVGGGQPRRGPGENLLVAAALVDESLPEAGDRANSALQRFLGRGPVRLAGRSRAIRSRGQGYEFDVPLLAGGLRRRRPGHRPRPYRARPWRRRLGAGPGERAAGARHGRTGRRLSARRAAVRRQARSIAETASRATPTRRSSPRSRRRGGLLARGNAGPFLPAFLALEGAADLPQHAAMVHQHGDERPAPEGAGGDRRHALDPAAGP